MKTSFLKILMICLLLLTAQKSFAQELKPFHQGDANHRQGVYNHQVLSAISKDSVHWQKDGKVLFEHASAPGAVITQDNTIYLYFMDVSEDHTTSVAKSGDFGKTWQKQNIEITNRRSIGLAMDPTVLLLDDGTIRLFYFALVIKPAEGMMREQEAHTIYSALSKDGIHFQEEPGIRYSAPRITDPDVIKTNKGWKLFLTVGQTNVSASSQDGMSFTLDAQPASRNGAISSTIAVEGGYRMFKCSRGIAAQFTTDFLSWKEEGVVLPPETNMGICDPALIKLPDGTYKMFYKQMPILF